MGRKRSIILFLVIVCGLFMFTPADGGHHDVLKTVLLKKEIGIEGVKSRSDRLKKERAKMRRFESNFKEQNALEINQFHDRSPKDKFHHLHIGSFRFQIKANGEWIR